MKIFDTGDLTPSTPLTPDERSWIYNGLDCALTAEIWESLAAEVDNIADNIYRNISRPLQSPILAMNMTGILTDQVTVAEMLNTLRLDIEKTVVRLRRLSSEGYDYDFAPAEFTASGRQKRGDALNSSDEIGRFLYDYIGLPEKRKRNQKGGFSRTTDRQALESLAESFYHVRPFIWHLLELRDLTKQVQFLSTEIDPDGRMRCNFNIAGTNTGRLSSSYSDMGTGTNLQNVGRRLRVVFVAPKGKKFANLDLEQADSRNVGATCWNRFVEAHGERFAGSYLDACESGDLHTRVTRMARPELAWPEEERAWRGFADAPQDIFRGKSYRDLSKNLGHGSNYLLSAASAVLKIPGLSIDQAKEFNKKYFTAFQCIPLWHDAVWEDLKETSQITTIWGRRRYFFGRPEDHKTLRTAVAYEGQSATADEINQGLLRLYREGQRFPGFRLCAQVHDSVLFEYDEECENEIIPWAIHALRVPLILARGREFIVPTEAKVGWNWGDYNDDPKRGRVNLDGLQKWKGGDKRVRLQQPRTIGSKF